MVMMWFSKAKMQSKTNKNQKTIGNQSICRPPRPKKKKQTKQKSSAPDGLDDQFGGLLLLPGRTVEEGQLGQVTTSSKSPMDIEM